ncbi:putative non-specific serine/threonine protein kinase [Medicago truncatula]|uniref:Putative non-specific serine/threonine protein kinase n=1 Tax=Medicago truncatula TaxID=3880 RepID=A0A396GHT6_MEDTR|nr:putative non-specific serine/threonine protein kinase [Medicago truncatula]
MISFEIKKQVVLIYLWLWWSTTTSICGNATKDSLKPGDTLNSNSTLCSKQDKYCLCLNSSIGHLIIRTLDGAVVWMYDRNQPIDIDSSVLLSLDYSGVLKIEFQNRNLPIIIYSSPQPTNDTVATMLDTGNFVLQQLHPNGTKSILWQSFDYPTYILISTMKLGVNRKTGHNWSLVSWLTPSLPTPGKFSLVWEPKERELNIRKSGKVHWKSGKLKSNGIFENIPTKVQRIYQYIIVSNKNEDSFAFEVKDGKFARWQLTSKGRLVGHDGEIGNADMCYGYNSNGGCQKWEEIPNCRENGEVFQKIAGTPNVDNATTFEQDVTYSYSDCKIRCWRNCNCNGFQEFYGNGTGCIFYSWNSTQDVDLVSQNNFYVLVNSTKSAPNSHGT